jgi:hypothetical protein
MRLDCDHSAAEFVHKEPAHSTIPDQFDSALRLGRTLPNFLGKSIITIAHFLCLIPF